MNDKHKKEFYEKAEALIDFIREHGHPHMSIIIDSNSAELVEGVAVMSKAKKSPG